MIVKGKTFRSFMYAALAVFEILISVLIVVAVKEGWLGLQNEYTLLILVPMIPACLAAVILIKKSEFNG